jgi:hypothetical protein
MTLKGLTALIFPIFLFAASAASQTPQAAAPQSKPGSSPQQQSFMPLFKRTVTLLRVGYLDNGTLMVASGTACFVFYPDSRLGENRGFFYLVTNRHAVQPGIEDGHPHRAEWMTIRLNRKGTEQVSTDERMPTGADQQWYFPTNDSVDLAVFPLLPDQTKYDFAAIPTSVFATGDVVESQTITEGDTVLFTGYFYQFPGMKKFEPIVREGILAMIPYEELDTTLKKRGRIYLADVRAFQGNSGSPMIVNVGGLRNGHLTAGYDYRLLGIISGYYHEDSDLTLTVATTLTGTVKENSGIAMVVPVDELKSILESSVFKALRDSEVAANKPKN